MRSIAVIFIVIVTLTHAQTTSEYRVVRVVGKVENPVLNRQIKTGDVILSKDKLKFANERDYIIIISPQTGRKKISGVPGDKSRELLELLQSFVQPELRSTATRSVNLRYVEMLQASLAYDTLLILGDGFVPVDTKQLSLSKPAVIRAWYTEFRKMVYRPISTDNGFKLDSRSVFGDGMPALVPKVVIEYFEDEKEEPMFGPGVMLAAFVPMYVDEAVLAGELRVILELHKSLPADRRVTEVRNYLAAEYANAQESNVKNWLKQQGIISE